MRSCKWLPYQILYSKTVKNVQNDVQQRSMTERAKRPVSESQNESLKLM